MRPVAPHAVLLFAAALFAAPGAFAQVTFSGDGRSGSSMGISSVNGPVTVIPGGAIIRHEAPLPPPAKTPDDPLLLASLDFRPVEGRKEDGLVGRIALPRGAQRIMICVGRYDDARHNALIDLRQRLALLDAELARDTAPVEYEGMPSVSRTSRGTVFRRSTVVKRSARDVEIAEQRASERARSMIEDAMKTLDWRITPRSDGFFTCAPIPEGRYILIAAARVQGKSDGRNIAPSRQLYWAGVFDHRPGTALGAILGEENGTPWRKLFP